MRFKAIISLLEQTGKDFTRWIDGEWIDKENLLQHSQKWSSGERALIDLALSLYSPEHKNQFKGHIPDPRPRETPSRQFKP